MAIMSAIFVLISKNPVHSVLWLIVVFVAISGHYILLDAQFLAIVNLIVYAGAIMVLFIFTIMLLTAGTEQKSKARLWVKFAGLPLLVAFLAIAGYIAYDLAPASDGVNFGSFNGGGPEPIGRALFTVYLLPFEVTSVLILIALIGAIVLARKEIE